MKRFAIAIFLLNGIFASAADNVFKTDSMKLSLAEAERIFAERSLSLIAAKYNIDVAHSQVLDAKLWYNPQLSYANDLYDPETKKWFDNSITGTYDVQLSQLISFAGRHSNAVKLAKVNEKLTEFQFLELVRDLKFEVYNQFNLIVADIKKQTLYENEIQQLRKLLQGEQQQVQLGVAAKNELIRLTAEMQDIQNSYVQNNAELNQAEKELKTLLRIQFSVFVVAEETNSPINSAPPLEQIVSTAKENRPDLKISQMQIDYQTQNLSLQRSLAWPDLTFNYEHTFRGNYENHYNGIGVSFPLPVFNRNQHIIHSTNTLLAQAQVQDSLQQSTVENEVTAAYLNYINLSRQLNLVDKSYPQQLGDLNRFAFENYSKHLINLIDFLDQVRTYTQAELSLIELNRQYQNSIHTLNYVTASNVIK